MFYSSSVSLHLAFLQFFSRHSWSYLSWTYHFWLTRLTPHQPFQGKVAKLILPTPCTETWQYADVAEYSDPLGCCLGTTCGSQIVPKFPGSGRFAPAAAAGLSDGAKSSGSKKCAFSATRVRGSRGRIQQVRQCSIAQTSACMHIESVKICETLWNNA